MLEKIDIHSDVAVFQQIENHIQFAIASGKLKAGDQLPTVKELAERLGINFNTVGKAYRDLDVMGYVYSRRGMGIFVQKGIEAKCREACHKAIITRMHEVISEAKSAGMDATKIKAAVSKCIASDVGPYEETPKAVLSLAKKK